MTEPTVIELAEAVRSGERKAVEVLDEYLGRIAKDNERLNAFVHLDSDLAHAAAAKVDEAVARGEDPGPLAGVPFGVKDEQDVAGMPTTYGSVPFRDNVVARDSTLIKWEVKLADCVLCGTD